MQGRTRQELYRAFLDFIGADIQRERKLVNRRMFSVALWCFLIPVGLVILVLVMSKIGVLPRSVRGHLDWLLLIFPVGYSLYILGSEVIAEIPASFRKGGVATSLGQSVHDSEWREKVRESMSRSLQATEVEWIWIVESFGADLKSMQYRARYMTALAGAVFFLIMQGIDSLTSDGDASGKVTWVKNPLVGWVELTQSDFGQFVGLALFLVLFYLSSTQTAHSLGRYLNCAELNLLEKRGPRT
ncbi:MAG: hypothetical protein ACXVBW_13915 [Bdellovibrionota bacterium]